MNNIDLAEKLVEHAKKLGAEEAEAYVSNADAVSIQVKNAQVDTLNYRSSAGYGLRVLIDGRMGFASSNSASLDTADQLIKKLVAATRNHTPDEHNVLPKAVSSGSDNGDFIKFDEKLAEVPVEKKIATAMTIDKAARESDKRIVQVGLLLYGDAAEEYAIVSSTGIHGQSKRSFVYGFVLPAAMDNGKDGNPDPATVQTGMALDVKSHFAPFDPTALGKKGAHYALRMLGAGPGQTAEFDAIFPPETGTQFMGLIANLVSADDIQKDKSLFTGRKGEKIASDIVTIIDDGRLKDGLASAAVDGEGVPTSTTEIVKNGVLSRFLFDSYTAHRGNTTSTGNASRSSFDARPEIAPTNFYLKPGNISRDDLLASIGNGIYVTEVTGLHASVDPVTGNFSIPSKGIMIAGGELTTPVSDITISGNFFDFMRAIDTIADDLTWEMHGNFLGAPTFKVTGLKIGGK